jgi:hypothetical protein
MKKLLQEESKRMIVAVKMYFIKCVLSPLNPPKGGL